MAEADPRHPGPGPLRTLDLVRDRLVESVLSRAALNHAGLTAEIRRQLGSREVDEGALLREPVIEGAAPFETDGRTFADCAGSLLHPQVIRAITDDKAEPYRFPPDAQPYRHQIAAWQHLTAPEPRSVLVSSGTGSGKTECFLMPLLHDLATESEQAGRLSGVRAIALYPLNALIASQEERLRAWTAPFEGRIRFGLYNGLTPELPDRHAVPRPEQVADRQTLRADPPPILVTNVTMLEYMMVRRIDRPLIENSRGTLRWIILDEAHGYVGSAAAEIALLIRRVLLTFGVRAEDVRFVATSATIGSGRDVTDELRRFLQDLTGTRKDRVQVVMGHREPVALPSPAPDPRLCAEALADREALRANPAVQAFVRAAEQGPVRLDQAARLLAPAGLDIDTLIRAIADDSDRQRGPLLPLRVHGFLRAVPGLWSCINPDCADSPPDWPFGRILADRVEACPSCSAPVLEILSCRECGEPYLDCEEEDGHLRARLTPPPVDEFAELREAAAGEAESADDTGEADAPEAPPASPLYAARRLALALRGLDGFRALSVDPASGAVLDAPQEKAIAIHAAHPDHCGACGGQDGAAGSILRPFRFGAPFLIGNAAPVMLDGVPRRAPEAGASFRPPAEGRQLLSFTDSRQGTARFAANLQTNAERGFVRGFLYHAVQGSMKAAGADSAQAQKLAAEIAQLEAVASDALAGLIADKKAELASLLRPSLDGLAWADMRKRLAECDEVRKWMRDVWQLRDSRFRSDVGALAEFLLLRELARRPRRANTAETLGLVRLRFPAIDLVRTLPQPLADAGFALADWQGLLHGAVDMVARANLAIRIADADLHWITRRGWRKDLLPYGEGKEVESQVAWPRAGGAAAANLVLVLEKALVLDRTDSQGRALLNEVLEQAWQALFALFTDPARTGLALDFDKARIAPVVDAHVCPVTRRILPQTLLGLTPYGHREHLRPAGLKPRPVTLPALPLTFPASDEARTALQDWLASDPQVAILRAEGVWTSLHDRAALLSPYARAAEHSAQQPPQRLRRFEAEFKAGEINILNCSTTMEMGVDIGSVSAVMMTNLPPALANYRQRVGRAGRRRQGFAMSLTYTRYTPLDREAFREPALYLARETRAPAVRLDSRRIAQRHVNALLLARWFASEGAEALKARSGDFFGCPEGVGAARPDQAPVDSCLAWLKAPGTERALSREVADLVRSTALEGDSTVFATSAEALGAARDSLVLEWQAMQDQAATAPAQGRKALEYQLRRLARENLMSELALRNVLPGHGLPTGVVAFVHSDRPAADEVGDEGNDSTRQRRSFPSRSLDIAIRDYAPGAEVVVDGLVYRSAGVTLNWHRPAAEADVHEVQALRLFWTCPACGAADCGAVAPSHCPACRAEIPVEAQRRFLQPAGFVADMSEKPHAETDDVIFVPSEPEQIVARGAGWQPMADPGQGRLRASSEGLVFHSSKGPGQQGYHICLDCGRAEPAAASRDGKSAMAGHLPLRGSRNGEPCPGNDNSYRITRSIALGCETVTDVAEIQPAQLADAGAAWALVSALREALSRRLGVETGELGMGVQRVRGLLGQTTHSLFLFDRASGGAGFAPQAASQFEDLVRDACVILDCREPGCRTGCSACVLTADLHHQQETINRQPALAWAREAVAAFGSVPDEDRVHPEARLSRSVIDELAAAVEAGAHDVVLWMDSGADVAGLADPGFARVLRRLGDRGGRLRLIVAPDWLDSLDAAARLGLRDAARALGLDLRRGTRPVHANGAGAIAQAGKCQWASRDEAARQPGEAWGIGSKAPVVRLPAGDLPLAAALDPDSLLPPSGTRFIEIGPDLDGTLTSFGPAFAALLLPAVRALSGSAVLTGMAYSDRYLQSPLALRLMTDALAALRDELAGKNALVPLLVTTRPLKPNERQPYLFSHDWQWPQDRDEVLDHLLAARGFAPELELGATAHGRVIDLAFTGGKRTRIVLDQGFGPWRTPPFARYDFGDDAARQAAKAHAFNAVVEAQGATYAVVTG